MKPNQSRGVRPFTLGIAIFLTLGACTIIPEREKQLPTLAPNLLNTQIEKLIETIGEPKETTLTGDQRRFKWVKDYFAVDCQLEVLADREGTITKVVWSGPFNGCKDWSDQLIESYAWTSTE